ncbi:hypothetical protein BKA69DRAFT_1128157 [Paraphysoderma sedebokerense]|nr:hypothetical protein BKA69DRAFT_1128157 [Paraphysoderma sedebokerense]
MLAQNPPRLAVHPASSAHTLSSQLPCYAHHSYTLPGRKHRYRGGTCNEDLADSFSFSVTLNNHNSNLLDPQTPISRTVPVNVFYCVDGHGAQPTGKYQGPVVSSAEKFTRLLKKEIKGVLQQLLDLDIDLDKLIGGGGNELTETESIAKSDEIENGGQMNSESSSRNGNYNVKSDSVNLGSTLHSESSCSSSGLNGPINECHGDPKLTTQDGTTSTDPELLFNEYINSISPRLSHFHTVINNHLNNLDSHLCKDNGSTICLTILIRHVMFCLNVGDSNMMIFDQNGRALNVWKREGEDEELGICSFEDTLASWPDSVKEGQCFRAVKRDFGIVQNNVRCLNERGERAYLLTSPRSAYSLRMTNTLGNLNHKGVLIDRTSVYKFDIHKVNNGDAFTLVLVTDGVKDVMLTAGIGSLLTSNIPARITSFLNGPPNCPATDPQYLPHILERLARENSAWSMFDEAARDATNKMCQLYHDFMNLDQFSTNSSSSSFSKSGIVSSLKTGGSVDIVNDEKEGKEIAKQDKLLDYFVRNIVLTSILLFSPDDVTCSATTIYPNRVPQSSIPLFSATTSIPASFTSALSISDTIAVPSAVENAMVQARTAEVEDSNEDRVDSIKDDVRSPSSLVSALLNISTPPAKIDEASRLGDNDKSLRSGEKRKHGQLGHPEQSTDDVGTIEDAESEMNTDQETPSKKLKFGTVEIPIDQTTERPVFPTLLSFSSSSSLSISPLKNQNESSLTLNFVSETETESVDITEMTQPPFEYAVNVGTPPSIKSQFGEVIHQGDETS